MQDEESGARIRESGVGKKVATKCLPDSWLPNPGSSRPHVTATPMPLLATREFRVQGKDINSVPRPLLLRSDVVRPAMIGYPSQLIATVPARKP